MNPLDENAARDERLWLRGTLTRASLRYGRALHGLSDVPGLLSLASLHVNPSAPDVQYAAETMARTLYRAIEELDQIALYMEKITDPGPTVCAVCGAELGALRGRGEFGHWRWVNDPSALFERRFEEYDAGHAPEPVQGDPPRPDWSDKDTDLLPVDQPTDERRDTE